MEEKKLANTTILNHKTNLLLLAKQCQITNVQLKV